MIEFQGDQLISLRDAIAIDFFLDNVKEILHGTSEEDNIPKQVKLLAISSYLLADIFCDVKDIVSQPEEKKELETDD